MSEMNYNNDKMSNHDKTSYSYRGD